MALKKAIKSFWVHYYNLGGHTSRSDYWWVMLSHVIMFVMWLGVLFSFGNKCFIREPPN